MISKITIDSFKSLQHVEVELGTINVFIGANGSGKSNFLEAFGILGAAAAGRVDDEALLRRGVRPGVPQLYKSAFPTTPAERRPNIYFGASNNAAHYEVALYNPMKDPKPAWRYMSEFLGSDGQKIVGRSPRRREQLEPGLFLNPDQGFAALKAVLLETSHPARQLLDQLSNFAIFCANTPTLRGLSPDQQPREPVGLSGGRLPEALGELLKARTKSRSGPDGSLQEKLNQAQSLIDWAKNFGYAPSAAMPLSPSAAASQLVVRFVDRYMAEKRNILTGYDASEGALYILFATVLALHEKSPSVFAIDNVDQALNPLLARKLTAEICNWILSSPWPRQVLITAHNPTVLDALPLREDPRVRLYTLDRDNRGRTAVRRVEVTDKMLDMAAKGWTLSRMWVNKLIGGVPDV